MNLLLNRDTLGEKSTTGELSINGTFECFVLEDTARAVKIHGKTCIPAGKYRVTITHSLRFDRELPLLNDVSGFAGIRIHPGNSDKDTEGCLLPGVTRSKDFVGSSRLAFEGLFAKLKDAVKRSDDIWIEIRGGFDHVEVP